MLSQEPLATNPEPQRDQVSQTLNPGLYKQTRWYKIFQKKLREERNHEKQKAAEKSYDFVQEALTQPFKFLWEALPQPSGSWDPKLVGNEQNPGDGVIFLTKQIVDAQHIMRDYHNALSQEIIDHEDPNERLPKIGHLTNKAMICLTLKIIRAENLLECFFLESGIEDVMLPLDISSLQRIFKGKLDDNYHARRFSTEQYRVVSRNWDDKTFIELSKAEPTPFLLTHNLASGSFASVIGVRHARSEQKYAQKAQNKDDAKRFHNEKDALELIDHRHVIRYVKGFQRGQSYYLLLDPVAEGTLAQLLDSYRNQLEDCLDQPLGSKFHKKAEERKIGIKRSFGCLSYALCYVHRDMSHKDIKPNNILYVASEDPGLPINILLADFGQAHRIPASGVTGTNNPRKYSLKFAAPDDMSMLLSTTHSSSTDRTDATEATTVVSKSTTSKPGSNRESHGRKDDVYSLGCVFFVILATLVKCPIPDYEDESFRFSKQQDMVRDWAEEYKTRPDCKGSLKFLFDLATRMTEPRRNIRPNIAQVTIDLMDSEYAPEYFCELCRREADADHENGKLEGPLRTRSGASKSTMESVSGISEEGEYLWREATKGSRHGRYLEPPSTSAAKKF